MDVKFPEMQIVAMNQSLQKRVKAAMDAKGMNALQTSKKAGLGESFVRDILRGKTRSPSAENMEKLANALEVSVDDLMGVVAAVGSTAAPNVGLEVASDVAAGLWLEVTMQDAPHEHETIPAARDPRFPRAPQYALRVVGDSMDLEFPEGSYVTCVDWWGAGLQMKDGQVIHVERKRAGGQLVEITIKVLESRDGAWWLAPRSSNPKWTAFPVEATEDTEIAIKGVVTGFWKPREF